MAEKKILVVLPPIGADGYAYDVTRSIWTSRGHKVVVSSLDRGVVATDDGRSVPVDLPLGDVKYYDYDAIAFVGGEGARLLYDDERARKLAKDAKYKPLGAMGSATLILALAGVLEGKKATVPPEQAGWAASTGAKLTGRPFEQDEKLFTVQDQAAFEQFANALLKAFE
ncbi:MAG: DJ-1/PfpI family protein [Anaerolineae bacterium]